MPLAFLVALRIPAPPRPAHAAGSGEFPEIEGTHDLGVGDLADKHPPGNLVWVQELDGDVLGLVQLLAAQQFHAFGQEDVEAVAEKRGGRIQFPQLAPTPAAVTCLLAKLLLRRLQRRQTGLHQTPWDLEGHLARAVTVLVYADEPVVPGQGDDGNPITSFEHHELVRLPGPRGYREVVTQPEHPVA